MRNVAIVIIFAIGCSERHADVEPPKVVDINPSSMTVKPHVASPSPAVPPKEEVQRIQDELGQALLSLRALYLNSDWTTFVDYRIRREQTEIYPYKSSIAAQRKASYTHLF
jgi:hypothetical protein